MGLSRLSALTLDGMNMIDQVILTLDGMKYIDQECRLQDVNFAAKDVLQRSEGILRKKDTISLSS